MNQQTKIEAASLSAALVKALAEVEGATKDKLNPHFKSKYADLGSVMDAIKPALAKHGLGFTQAMHDASNGVCVETVIHHEGGESLSCGKLFVPASKQDAQSFGSALTYARRYSLMTAFGVPAEDDDGNAASRSAPRHDATVGVITEQQFRELQDYADAKVIDLQRFCAFFQIPSLKALPADRFAEAKAMAEAKKAKVTA